MRFKVYKDTRGEWRWRLKSANGNTLADSGEGYKNKQDCIHAVNLVKGTINVPVDIDPG